MRKILIITAFMLGLAACDGVKERADEWELRKESKQMLYECLDAGYDYNYCKDYALHG